MTSVAAINFFIMNESNLQEQLQPSRVNFTTAIVIILFVRRELQSFVLARETFRIANFSNSFFFRITYSRHFLSGLFCYWNSYF